MTAGDQIRTGRERMGWTRRYLGSKLGLTLRKMKALEGDMDPEPCLEKRVYSMKYIDFLGYAVWVYNDWPVRDKSWDLEAEQTRALKFLGELNG